MPWLGSNFDAKNRGKMGHICCEVNHPEKRRICAQKYDFLFAQSVTDESNLWI
jgi:hypothetical protein